MDLNIEEVTTSKAEIVKNIFQGKSEKKEINANIPNKIPNVGSFQTISNIKNTDAVLSVPKQVQFSASIANNEKISEPKVKSYDDILSKMGMCVVNGKLKLYDKSTPKLNSNQSFHPRVNQQTNPTQSQRNWQKTCRVKRESQYSAPRQIFQQPCAAPMQMTQDEYKRMVYEEHIKERRKAAEMRRVKSRKLLFDNPATNIRPSVMKKRPNSNVLFKLKE